MMVRASEHRQMQKDGHEPKERIEVFCEGAGLHLGNFHKLTGFGWGVSKNTL